jgi:uncharacterized ferritin-like protein (DUF455 family)
LFARTEAVLLESELPAKLAETTALAADWTAGRLRRDDDLCPVLPVADPGRPARPELVSPQVVPQRPMTSLEGRAAMLHAIAHIEFCAINLALDAAYRFRHLPDDYYADWLGVAAEEAEHFSLIRQRLQALGYDYGDFLAHGGLWDLAQRSADDALARMALVPRMMEARGLDATPPLLAKFAQVGDAASVAVLEVILRDEVGHVALGDRWFRYLCAERGLAPEETYRQLLRDYRAPKVRPPFNVAARMQAGFSAAELAALADGV